MAEGMAEKCIKRYQRKPLLQRAKILPHAVLATASRSYTIQPPQQHRIAERLPNGAAPKTRYRLFAIAWIDLIHLAHQRRKLQPAHTLVSFKLGKFVNFSR